jgi:hypothetical protein
VSRYGWLDGACKTVSKEDRGPSEHAIPSAPDGYGGFEDIETIWSMGLYPDKRAISRMNSNNSSYGVRLYSQLQRYWLRGVRSKGSS